MFEIDAILLIVKLKYQKEENVRAALLAWLPCLSTNYRLTTSPEPRKKT